MVNGIFTAICLFAFIGIVIWAYSSRQKTRFEEAARLPLMDDTDVLEKIREKGL